MNRADWFAGRLRELREQAGYSREQLAERAGMKVGGIRDLEQAVNQPRWETVLALADALGVECTAFIQPPASKPEAKRGRPRKATAGTNGDKPKKTTPKRKAPK